MTKQEMIDRIGRKDIFSEDAICELLEYPDKDEVICELIKLIGSMQEGFYEQIEALLARVSKMEDKQSKIDFNITSTKKIIADRLKKEDEVVNGEQ